MSRTSVAFQACPPIGPPFPEVGGRVANLTERRPWGLRLLPDPAGPAAMAVLLAATLTALAWSSTDDIQQATEVDSREAPGSGMVVRSEVVGVSWRRPFDDPANILAHAPIATTHEELRRALAIRGLENLEYSVTFRGHQVNGGHADITFVRRPYDDPGHFQEFQDLLAQIGGTPEADPAASSLDADRSLDGASSDRRRTCRARIACASHL